MVDVAQAAKDLEAAKAMLAAAEKEVADAAAAPVVATAPVTESPAPAPAAPEPVAPVAAAPAVPPAASVVYNADGSVVGAPVPMPVVHAGEWRTPDINDVVVNGVIVGRHSEASVRIEILAKAKEWFAKVRSL